MAQAKAKKTPSKTAAPKKATASASKVVKKTPAKSPASKSSVTKSPVKAPAKKPAKAPAKPVVKTAAKPAPKAKPAAKPAAKTTAKTSAPKAAPAAKPVAKPAAKTATPKAEPPKKKAMTTKPAVKKTSTAPTAQATETASLLDSFTNFTPYNVKKGENYMNNGQIEHFRKILAGWKQELMVKVDETVHHMQDESSNVPDPNDRATIESDFTMELRTRDRERKLIKKIEESIKTLDSGDYGYCENCGEEIGIRRLEARPTAQLCIDCKTLDEIREKHINR